VLGRGGALSVVVPQAALDPLLRNSAQGSRDKAAPDPDWSRHIENEVKRAEVTLRALLTEEELTLGDIAALDIGKILPLKVNAASRVRLECNGQALFSCELGQVSGTYTLRVEEIIAQERGLVDDILSR
jgi:flagellar motor switch protein FliM